MKRLRDLEDGDTVEYSGLLYKVVRNDQAISLFRMYTNAEGELFWRQGRSNITYGTNCMMWVKQVQADRNGKRKHFNQA